MKRYLITVIAIIVTIVTMAESSKVWIYSHSGNHLSIDMADFDSLSFIEPSHLDISPVEKIISKDGSRFTLEITANKPWTASSNDPAVILGTTQGTGDATITCTALPNAEEDQYTATITVKFDDGTQKQSEVTVLGRSTDFVTDICGNTYTTVTIGTQVWMTQNMRCNKYDTQSEKAGSTIPTLDKSTIGVVYTPYYSNASNKSNWLSEKYAKNLSDVQISRLGFLYNWAAAVGVDDGKKHTTEFSGNRQGICPNGWHIPTFNEMYKLGWGDGSAGKKLAAKSGWYNDSYGTDDYGFSALPAGVSNVSTAFNIGSFTCFWTATPNQDDAEGASWFAIYYLSEYFSFTHNYSKYLGCSVRCLKN